MESADTVGTRQATPSLYPAEHLTLRLKPRPRSRKVGCTCQLEHPWGTDGNSFNAHMRFVQAVKWAEDVVDNEGMNKKKSKSECSQDCQITAGSDHLDAWNPNLACFRPVIASVEPMETICIA